MDDNPTEDKQYTLRLEELQHRTWKTLLDVQRPYRWNLNRLQPGRTLDIGCGIGRCLRTLPPGSVGVDPNMHSIERVQNLGLIGYTPQDFRESPHYELQGFDTLLLSHVLEHMTSAHGASLIREYLPLLGDNGKVIAFCPQERGFATDTTHVNFLDDQGLRALFGAAGLHVERAFSFPFPRWLGRLFTYNEFVAIGRRRPNDTL